MWLKTAAPSVLVQERRERGASERQEVKRAARGVSARLLGKFHLDGLVLDKFGAHPAQACRLKQQSAIILFFPFSKEVFS